MNSATNSVTEHEMNVLREGIRAKYHTFQQIDQDCFPDLEYNTNRANYQPLKDSFETEFYEIRKIDRVKNNLHIPSTNTLALLFTSPDFVPSRKILTTCRSYAAIKPAPILGQEVSGDKRPLKVVSNKKKLGKILSVSLLLTAVVVIAAIIFFLPLSVQPDGLIISSPRQKQGVHRLLTISGKVANADTVWIVVHPVAWNKDPTLPIGGLNYYVQPPIKVNKDGTWQGRVYIGGVDSSNIGVQFQLRAFVLPDVRYRVIEHFEQNIFGSWPDAVLATKVVEVVRSK